MKQPPNAAVVERPPPREGYFWRLCTLCKGLDKTGSLRSLRDFLVLGGRGKAPPFSQVKTERENRCCGGKEQPWHRGKMEKQARRILLPSAERSLYSDGKITFFNIGISNFFFLGPNHLLH